MKNKIVTFVKNYKILSIISLVFLTLAIIVGVIAVSREVFRESDAAPQYPDLYFVPSTTTVQTNSSNNVLDLYMRTNSAEVTGLLIELDYDPNVITNFVMEPVTPFIDLCSFSSYCDLPRSDGKIQLSLGTGLNPVKGDIKVASIVFGVGNASEKTTLSFSDLTTVVVLGSSSNQIGMMNSHEICVGSCVLTTPEPTQRTRPSRDRNSPTPTNRRSNSRTSIESQIKSVNNDVPETCNFRLLGMCLSR